jgi:hypothetical protein
MSIHHNNVERRRISLEVRSQVKVAVVRTLVAGRIRLLEDDIVGSVLRNL